MIGPDLLTPSEISAAHRDGFNALAAVHGRFHVPLADLMQLEDSYIKAHRALISVRPKAKDDDS